MPYRLSRRAIEDFLDIHAYGVATFGFARAELYANGLEATFDLLAENPKIARLRTELRQPVRIHPYGAHLIMYREEKGSILVVRIHHGRRNWKRRLR